LVIKLWQLKTEFDADLTKKDVVDKVPSGFEDVWIQITGWFR